MQKIIWHHKTKTEISSFPKDVKDKLGYLIFRLQMGEPLSMPVSRGISAVAKGVKELRVRGKDGIYRSFYLTISGNKLIIFHAFKKKTQKTLLKDIKQGKKNLKEAIQWEGQK